MAISLSNAASGKKEPKRANRWILKFESVPVITRDSNVEELNMSATDRSEQLAIDLQSASRPTLNVNADSSISRLNEKWKFAVNPTWEPITVTFYDFEAGAGSATQILWRWMQTIYDVLNGTMGYAATYKVDASLILLNPGQTADLGGNPVPETGIEIVEAWDLFGCFPGNMSTGDLSYESTDVLTVSVELNFDYANLHTGSDKGTRGWYKQS
jgi:hypothetical protein